MRCYNYPTFVSHGSGSWKLAAQDHGDVLGEVSLPGYVLAWSSLAHVSSSSSMRDLMDLPLFINPIMGLYLHDFI